jgi:hypothetical protein
VPPGGDLTSRQHNLKDLISDVISIFFLFFSNVRCLPYYHIIVDDPLDCDQSRPRPIPHVHHRQHWISYHDCNEHHSVLPSPQDGFFVSEKRDQENITATEKLNKGIMF